MRLALVTQSCDNETGIGRIVLSLATEFEKQGHDVHVIAQSFGIQEHRWKKYRVPLATSFNSVNRLALRFSTQPVLKRLDCDIVNAFMIGRGASVLTAQSCHIAGLDIRNEHKSEISWRRNLGFFDKVAVQDEKVLVHSPATKRIIAVSQLVKQQFMAYYNIEPNRIVVVPNGVDVAEFARIKTRVNRESLRSRYGIHTDQFLLLFVGNEFDRKGLQALIHSIALLNRPEIRLLVIGSDDQAPYVRLAEHLGISDKVTYAGKVQGPEAYFACADAFVFPTLYEPFGMVIIEAMAAALPVIASRHAGALEGCTDGEHGLFLQDPLSIEELAHAIRRLVDDEQLRARIAAGGTAIAQNLSWEKVAAQTLGVYEEARTLN